MHEVRSMSRNAHSGPLDKNACQVVQKKKFHSGFLSRDLMSNNSYRQFLNSSDSHRSAGVSPLRRYRSGNISPYQNESPKSPFRGVGFLGVPKEVEAFDATIASSRKMLKALQDVSKNQINERAADPIEKTLYVDYVKTKDLSSTKPFRLTKAEEFANSLIVGSKKPSPKSVPTANVIHSAYSPKPRYAADATDEGVKRNEALYQELINEAKLDVKEEHKVASDNARELDAPLKSPLPPPLPKSQSESWLWRTLPSIPLGNPFANSRNQKKQGQKISAANTKWETIVKISNSDELVRRASYRPMKS